MGFERELGTEKHISIKSEWDYAPRIKRQSKEGCHIPRDERKLVVDFLCRRNEGALLISGKRGVGKSSFVFSAIHEASDRAVYEYSARTLPVLVNAPSFEIRKVDDKGEKLKEVDLLEFKRIVLQNLVRRLYQATRYIRVKNGEIEKDGKGDFIYDENLDTKVSKPIKKGIFRMKHENAKPQDIVTSLADHTKVSELFTRAVAKEVREETNVEELEKEQNRIETEAKTQLNMVGNLIVIGAALVSSVVIAFTNPLINQTMSSVAALLTAILPTATIAVSWQRTKKRLSENEQQKTASMYYYHDYDVSTLQSELEEKLMILAQHKPQVKVIFVIDELDKMDYKDVINVIKSLKTLFNQASALFILVTGEEFYRELVKYRDERLPEYTLFPLKIFLQRPDFEDVRKFMNRILLEPTFSDIDAKDELKEYKVAYQKFQNYACYVSKTDYFDLYDTLRDYMSFDQNHVRLKIDLDKKLETYANLQRAVEDIFVRKKLRNQSDWYKNDLLIEKMYELLTNLAERKSDIKFLRIRKGPEFKIELLNDLSSELQDLLYEEKNKFSEMEKEAMTDFINYLTRLQYLNYLEGDNYEIRGILDDIPSNIKILTKEEDEFLRGYERLQYLIITYANLYNAYEAIFKKLSYENINEKNDHDILELRKIIPSIPDTLFTSIESLFQIYKGLTRDFPRVFGKEHLEDNTKMINDVLYEIFRGFILLVKRIVEVRSEDVTIVPVVSNDSLNKTLGMRLPTYQTDESAQFKNLLIESSQNKKEYKQLLVVQNPSDEVLGEIDRIETDRNYFSALILKVDTAKIVEGTLDDFKKQTETSSELKWYQQTLRMEIPTSYSLADAIETALKWVYAVEKGRNKDIQDWMQEGLKAIEVLNFSDAIYRYDKALELDSKNEFAMYQKGRIYLLENDSDQALEWFNKVLEVNPNHSGALVNRTLVLRRKQGLDKELIVDPEIYDKIYTEGSSEDRNLQTALESLDKELASKPMDYTKLYEKGELLLVSRRSNEAQEAFDKVIEINNKHDLSWHFKGVICFSQKRYEEALKCFDTAIEINPRFAEALYHRGMVLNSLERYSDAIQSFDQVLRISPVFGLAYYGRAISKAKRNKKKEALADLEKAMEIGYPGFDKDYMVELVKREEKLENLREDQRFKKIFAIESPAYKQSNSKSKMPNLPSQTAERVRANIVKIVNSDGRFYGTGYAIRFKEVTYCITCHHCIYKLDAIYIEKDNKKYYAEWKAEFSDMSKDIAVLVVNSDMKIEPLSYAMQAMPALTVSIFGFSSKNLANFPEGTHFEGATLSSEHIPFRWEAEGHTEGNQPWNKKPEVSVFVYRILGKFEVGYSGAPVCYSQGYKVIGTFAAKDDEHGYVIPMEEVLYKFEN